MTVEEEVHSRIRSAMDAGGGSVVDAIQEEINEAYPPSSDPGTPPHRRTGWLRLGVNHATDDGGTVTVDSLAFYSKFLRDGTSKMAPRDYFGDEMTERMTEVMRDRAQEEFGE